MRILFCGGGTVGHLTPAIAVADALKQKDRSNEIAFVGRCGGDENKIIERFGYKLYTINVNGIQRKLTIKNIRTLFLAKAAKKEAYEIIKRFKPDAIMGTGGFVCWPVMRAAMKA